jgi:hypothetical protein
MSGRRPRRSVRHPDQSEAREGPKLPANVRRYAAPATLVLLAVMDAFAVVVHATAGFKPLQ